jgi:5-methylcytosine-specific restriction endonuclease McrA
MTRPRVCGTPGCPLPAAPGTGRCPTHTRAPWRPGSSTRKATLPPDWPDIRAAVLTRDGGTCRCPGCPNCAGAPCTRPATSVDHIGDRHDHSPGNLRALCWGPGTCHAHRSSRQGGTR